MDLWTLRKVSREGLQLISDPILIFEPRRRLNRAAHLLMPPFRLMN
jgi:hypothetical protein